LAHVSALNHIRTYAAAFGSYGWSGDAVPNIEARLKMLRMNVLPGLRIKFKPSEQELKKAVEFGAVFAQALLEQDSEKVLPVTRMEAMPPLLPQDYPRQYKSKDIIVYWDLRRCIHDTQCFERFPHIFDSEARPWFKREGNAAEEIIKAIDRCPSGALKYSLPEGSSVDKTLAHGPGSFDQADANANRR
jgi:uncharacterized Fe-S cluster protein YjdI